MDELSQFGYCVALDKKSMVSIILILLQPRIFILFAEKKDVHIPNLSICFFSLFTVSFSYWNFNQSDNNIYDNYVDKNYDNGNDNGSDYVSDNYKIDEDKDNSNDDDVFWQWRWCRLR